MAPQTKNSLDLNDLIQTEPKKTNRLEVLYDGFYYDVTDFARKHPGGSVINYYTEKGEDATQAIQQFHNRASNKVQIILKSFNRRPATSDDVWMDATKLKRHRALTDDFTKLFVEIQKEGLFDPSPFHVAYRMFELAFMAGIYVIFRGSPYLPVRILNYVWGGLIAGRAGFFTHETGHKALTGKLTIDRFLQSAVYGLVNGLSSNWWNRNHNKHHAMPQRLHHDVDLDTMPFLAYNAKVIKDAKKGKSFFIQNQTKVFSKKVILWLSMDAFVGIMGWKLYFSPMNALKRGNYMDLFFICLHWYFSISYLGFVEMMIITWIASNYMFGNFTLSHTHTPVTEEATHWVEYALTHTVDVSYNIFVDWWMGHLNYQIEHHLFPTMPDFKAFRVRDRVKALAEKHGLKYQCLTFKDAWATTIQNMVDVAKEFADK